MIPGDVGFSLQRILFVSQGTLTGESLPVEKFHDADPRAAIHPPNSRTHASWARAFKVAQRLRSWS